MAYSLRNLQGINHRSQTMTFSDVLWKTGSFDIQICSIHQEKQYGCNNNSLQQRLFILKGFINKHGEPLITTRTIKFTIKYYQFNINENSLLLTWNTFCDKVIYFFCFFCPVPYYSQISMSVSAVYTTVTVQLHVQTL